MSNVNQEELKIMEKNNIKKKKLSKKWIILSGIIFILVIIGFNLFQSVQAKNKDKKFNEYVLQADNLLAQKDYGGAIAKYKEAKDIKSDSDLTEKMQYADDLHASTDCFKRGMESFEKGLYKEALNNFKYVKEIDKDNYAIAQEKIPICKPEIIKKALVDAKEKANKEDYYGSLYIINDALNTLPNTTELVSAVDEYTKMRDNKMKAETKAKEAEIKAKAEAEAKQYEPKKITTSDNYNVWSSYTNFSGSHTFRINVTGGDNSNVIVYIDGQLVINEIGKGNYANSISLDKGWHKVEVESRMGYEWTLR